MTLPDGHMWKSEAAEQLGITGGGIRQLIVNGRIAEVEVTDSEGKTVTAISQAAVDAIKASGEGVPQDWLRPAWRETHFSIGSAARQLGVSQQLLRGLIGRSNLPIEKVQDSRGREVLAISKAVLAEVKAKMDAQS